MEEQAHAEAMARAEELNAVVARVDLPGRPDGPLAGVRVAVKDNVDVVGHPTRVGTAVLQHAPPARASALLVDQLRAAGAAVVAKTTMHELALGITNHNPVTGPCRNPHDPTRISGGSSGGSAVAVAVGAADLGVGTDTSGSVRIPAALCGIVGFRPTTGRYPAHGLVPVCASRDTIGFLARDVALVAAADAVVTGAGPLDVPDVHALRVGLLTVALEESSRAVVAATEQALDRLGATVVPVAAAEVFTIDAEVGVELIRDEVADLLDRHLRTTVGRRLADVVDEVRSGDVHRFLAHAVDAPPLADERRVELQAARLALAATYDRLLTEQRLDVLASPTTPIVAAPIGEDVLTDLDGDKVPTVGTYLSLASPAAVAGIPSISVPCGTVDGLPTGLQLEAARWADRRLLGVAAAVERALAL